ncbi:MAG: ABC transporter permease [Roseiflexaceae bacterium]|nr:ABC transporter permease [Roseiflexaceae bacterium]
MSSTEQASSPPDGRSAGRVRIDLRQLLIELLVPILAIFTALVIGALIIVATGASVTAAYSGLFRGALGTPQALANTLVAATPYIFAGLAVALGFKCGLFNIGAEGQLVMGAISAAVAGAAFTGLPAIIHLPIALIAGILGGALWGGIAGFLRAKTGAHEVITTIMLNYIAIRLTDYLIKVPLKDPAASAPRTRFISPAAELPFLFGADYRLNAGFILAILAAILIWWLLSKTTIGFEIRTVGANPNAAQYAGMSITRNFILAMALSGGLAGMAGASTVLGLEHNLKASFSAGYGFDSIAIALLARSNPLGIIPAAIFWGALRNGAGLMQLESGISINLINIVQALVIVFVAADQIVRWIYRIKRKGGNQVVFTRGWGG